LSVAGDPGGARLLIDGATAVARFEIQGIELVVRSNDDEALARIRDTYGWFADPARTVSGRGPTSTVEVALVRETDGFVTVIDSEGRSTRWGDNDQPLVALFDAIVVGLIAGLSRAGILAIHAGVVALDGRAILVSGRSGRGKTTLVLGLLRRGLDLLSDELALIAPDDRTVLAYPRALHVRPTALELFPELGFLAAIEPYELGGGSEWAVGPDAVHQALGALVLDMARVSAVVLLDGDPVADAMPEINPVPSAIATMELLRGTPAAAWDFDGVLARLPAIVGDVPCARIRSARLEETVDAVLDWAATATKAIR
jgi:hypothetical protein